MTVGITGSVPVRSVMLMYRIVCCCCGVADEINHCVLRGGSHSLIPPLPCRLTTGDDLLAAKVAVIEGRNVTPSKRKNLDRAYGVKRRQGVFVASRGGLEYHHASMTAVMLASRNLCLYIPRYYYTDSCVDAVGLRIKAAIASCTNVMVTTAQFKALHRGLGILVVHLPSKQAKRVRFP